MLSRAGVTTFPRFFTGGNTPYGLRGFFDGGTERKPLIQSTIGGLADDRWWPRLAEAGSGQQKEIARAAEDLKRGCLNRYVDATCALGDDVGRLADRESGNDRDILRESARPVLFSHSRALGHRTATLERFCGRRANSTHPD